MYQGDSFFTLSPLGATGLVMISLILAGITVILVRRLITSGRWWLRLAGALGSLWLFVWLSPQIYYAYYLLIFDGLPVQWVIGPPPSLMDIVRLLSFGAQPNLSAHSQGLLGWALIGAALWPHRQTSKQ